MRPKAEKESLHINGGRNQKTEWKTILLYLFGSLGMLFIGFNWKKEIDTKGYYIDRKYNIVVNGDDGIMTIYVLLSTGFILLAYTAILILNLLKNKG